MDEANENTILMCQIESPEGVEHIQEIIGVDGIDAAFVGPNDLSQNYGVLGEYSNPVMKQAYDKILKAAQTSGKIAGIHFGKKEPLLPCIQAGYQMNMCGNDVSFLMDGAKNVLESIKENTDK